MEPIFGSGFNETTVVLVLKKGCEQNIPAQM